MSILRAVRAEFFRGDDDDRPVGTAIWADRRVRMETGDRKVREALARIFRASPVSVEDPAASDAGAAGGAVVEPGDLAWFRTAALVRGRDEGLRVRFVTDAPGGWDPAGAYRPLEVWTAAREGNEPPPSLGTSRA